MAIYLGAIFIVAGALLAWSVGGVFWAIWRGVTALLLVFIGLVTLLIAVSARRAKKQYKEVTQNAVANEASDESA